MHIATVLSYKDGWQELQRSQLLSELLDGVQLFYEKKASNNEQGFSQPLLEQAFLGRGWSVPPKNFKLGVVKNNISFRTIDGTPEFIYQWLFADCKKAHQQGGLVLPILFVRNKSDVVKQNQKPKKPTWTYFEKIYEQIISLSPINIDFPFVILSVNDSEFDFGTPHVIELPHQNAAFSRPTEDKVTLLEKDISIPDHLFEPYLLLLNSFAKFVTNRHSGENTVFSYKIVDNKLELLLSTEFESCREVTETINTFNDICTNPSNSFDIKDVAIHRLYDQLELVKAQLRISERYEAKYKYEAKENGEALQHLISLISKSTAIKTIAKKVDSTEIEIFSEKLRLISEQSDNNDFRSNSKILIQSLKEVEGDKEAVRNYVASFRLFLASVVDTLQKGNQALTQSAKLLAQLTKVKKLVDKFLQDNDLDEEL